MTPGYPHCKWYFLNTHIFTVRELQVHSEGDEKGQETLSSKTANVSTSFYSQI